MMNPNTPIAFAAALRQTFLVACSVTAIAAAPLAQAQHNSKETKEDVQRHRAMAAAHEGAAKCLEAGKSEDVCLKELQAACKGIAVGKYCGMKHAH